jgi:hypothetical protein
MIVVKVTPDDGEAYELTIAARDVLVWEKTSKGNPSFLDFLEDMNLRDLYKMAHIAAWRQQLFAGTLDEFEKTCDVNAEMDHSAEGEGGEGEDPTESGVSPDDSSNSQSERASARPRGQKRASAR